MNFLPSETTDNLIDKETVDGKCEVANHDKPAKFFYHKIPNNISPFPKLESTGRARNTKRKIIGSQVPADSKQKIERKSQELDSSKTGEAHYSSG